MEFEETLKKQLEGYEEQENELQKQISEIKKKKSALKKYMMSIELLEVKKRGRRKKTEEAIGS